MKDKVAAALARTLPDGAVVYCACSGGADSAALLCVLRELSESGGFTLRAAHYNHQLRGAASDADEALVRDLCGRLGIPLTVERGDVRARAESSDDSLEEAARRMRYAFFDRLPGYVATAHTADDNLETLLINLIRGTSLAGLAGIPPVRDRILRPMLSVTHAEALAFLESRGIPHATDESNASRSFLRNRIRMDLVPLLQRENPRILEQTLAMTGRLREDEAWLSRCAEQALSDARRPEGYDCRSLRDLPSPLLSRAAICLLSDLPDRSAAHVDALCALIRSESPSARIDLPGGRTARRVYDLLCMDASDMVSLIPVTPLRIPGTTELERFLVTVELSETPSRGEIVLPVSDTLYVRSRMSGDRILLPAGHRSLHRLMIDRKIPAAVRDSIPVLCTRDGPIALLGVPGAAPPAPADGPCLIITCKEKRQ